MVTGTHFVVAQEGQKCFTDGFIRTLVVSFSYLCVFLRCLWAVTSRTQKPYSSRATTRLLNMNFSQSLIMAWMPPTTQCDVLKKARRCHENATCSSLFWLQAFQSFPLPDIRSGWIVHDETHMTLLLRVDAMHHWFFFRSEAELDRIVKTLSIYPISLVEVDQNSQVCLKVLNMNLQGHFCFYTLHFFSGKIHRIHSKPVPSDTRPMAQSCIRYRRVWVRALETSTMLLLSFCKYFLSHFLQYLVDHGNFSVFTGLTFPLIT